jgi:hypothetical protein
MKYIKMILRDIEWIKLAQDMNRLQLFVINTLLS